MQPAERVLDARREAGRHQRPGDRRPAERVVVVRDETRRPGRRSAGRSRAAGRRSARTARGGGPLGGQRRLERLVVGVHPEAQDVQLALPQARGRGSRCALISTPGMSVIGAGIARRGHHVAVAGERVVIGQRQRPDAGLGGARRARRARGRRRSGSCGCGGRRSTTGRRRRARSPPRIVRAGGGHAAQASTRRWIRSMASARPVAGSMSIWTALKTTAPRRPRTGSAGR